MISGPIRNEHIGRQQKAGDPGSQSRDQEKAAHELEPRHEVRVEGGEGMPRLLKKFVIRAK